MTTLIPEKLGAETRLHIEKIQAEMAASGLDAMLIASNVNVFYATGRFFRGYVWIPAEGEARYFVIKPQIYAPTDYMAEIRKPEQIPDFLPPIEGRVGLEEDILTYSDIIRLRRLFPGCETANCGQALRNARMVKTPYELQQMEEDGRRHARVYSKISGLYAPGMTDVELQIAIENELRKEGCLGFARVAGNLMDINLGSVLAGENADNPSPYEFAMGGEGVDTSLPGGANGTPIRKGETVMVDMNGSFNAYQTDMTRCWTLGELPDIAVKANDCSRRILRELESLAMPGVETCSLYFRAVEIAEEEGLKEYFMGHRQQAPFIGHGVGIELNEQPPVAARVKTPLKENMTLALEPKFVLPGIGAVGVENTYAVKTSGLSALTDFPEEILKFE